MFSSISEKNPYCLHSGLGYRLTIAARANSLRFETKISDLGMTRQMWCVLVAVGEQSLNHPTDIAKYIGINKTSCSRTLRQMLDKSLITQKLGVKDGRTRLVYLTENGQIALQASLKYAHQSQRELAELFKTDEDQAAFSDLLGCLLPVGAPDLPTL